MVSRRDFCVGVGAAVAVAAAGVPVVAQAEEAWLPMQLAKGRWEVTSLFNQHGERFWHLLRQLPDGQEPTFNYDRKYWVISSESWVSRQDNLLIESRGGGDNVVLSRSIVLSNVV